MGSGQSVEVDAHLRRWDAAISELQEICQSNRRLIEHDRIYPMEKPSALDAPSGNRSAAGMDEDLDRSIPGPRRLSSLVSFHNQQHPNGSMSNVGGMGSGKRGGATPPESRAGVSVAGDPTRSSSVTGLPTKHNRQQVLEIKKDRLAIFKSYEVVDESQLGNVMECSHFGAAAVALTYLLGGRKDSPDRRERVTVEDIFFAAQIPLHMLHTGAPHLPVMTDAIREFIDVDNRFKGEYGIEAFHFDIAPTWGQVELGLNEVGDRQTKMQLPEFRKAISHDIEEERQVARIVNYDPYVLEQAMLVDGFDEDDEQCSELANSVLGSPQITRKQRYMKNNDGAYAVIVDSRNAVQLMVTIAEGVVNDSLHIKLTEVPAGALFKAMMSAEEGRRARGFIRIFKKDPNTLYTADEASTSFTPELCSGKVLGSTLEGTQAAAMSYHISPHIVSVAWAIHLLKGVRPNSHGYGNGLPVSDIIRTMRFPVEVFIDGRLQLGQVFEYAKEYIAKKNLGFGVELYPVLTKISRDDAVPTISVFDLESVLVDVKNANSDPESPEHIMVIMYNANVAHNVIHIAEEPQWCVLAGYDQESQTALLIDARFKTFSRTWSCPLDRLHKSMTTNGYLVFSKNKAGLGQGKARDGAQRSPADSHTAELQRVGAPPHIAATVHKHLETLQRQTALCVDHTDIVKTFTFPDLPMGPAMLALALCKIGIFTTFEDIIMQLPFEVSSLIIRNFTLEALGVCLQQYLHFKKLTGEIEMNIVHGERALSGEYRLPLTKLEELLDEYVVRDGRALLVVFDSEQIDILGDCNPFGRIGLVTSYNKEKQSVTVCDCNPNPFVRKWAVTLEKLHRALQDQEREGALTNRSRGCIALSRSTQKKQPMKYYREFGIDLLPVQNVFHVSPSAHIQGLSLAFAQLGHFYSPEEIFYEAYLKTMNDQRRRGSQAFAWRDVDVSLSVINKQIDAAFAALVCRKFLESRKVTSIQVERLDDVDVDEIDTLLKAATAPDSDHVLILNYDTAAAHNVFNMGRSMAIICGFDPETETVELLEAEHAVFGLHWRISLAKLIVIGELDNVGRSPYGFVKMSKRDTAPVKAGLAGPPADDDDDDDNGQKQRRSRDHVAKFVV